ncbi:hypothetical protein Sjap_021196 [Stephania japonica]|uniref:Protein kinase domain-containing protein n=1 Tax=Stephania japonica TaxID=461633 RepID=A0AAP0F4V6_9MAGN
MGRMGSSVRRPFSANPSDYKLLEEVGYGASATVYRAIYLPSNQLLAVKCLDLDRCNTNLGSCLHLMKIAYSDGFEEPVIASILKETLKALEYLHRHGHIHRDVKAGNILLDSNGVVKLGDFGVSACMFDKGDRQRTRNTFVGTPCWMAPEVLQPGGGYDFKADIWSFGITALELAHGHAPFSKYPPMKVLLMTIQNAPPGLDYDRDKKFSKFSHITANTMTKMQRNCLTDPFYCPFSYLTTNLLGMGVTAAPIHHPDDANCDQSFKEMVAMCLVKDQTKRPTAEKLLKHSFFKNAKAPEFSLKNLLMDLPPLWDRVKALQLKDAAQLALKKMPSAEEEALSQSEYKRGVSAWNFDVEDLKAQASLVQDDDDDDDVPGLGEEDESVHPFANDKDALGSGSSSGIISMNKIVMEKTDCKASTSVAEVLPTEFSSAKGDMSEIETLDASNKEMFDRYEKNGSINEPTTSQSSKDVMPGYLKTQSGKCRQSQSGPLVPMAKLGHSLSEKSHTTEKLVFLTLILLNHDSWYESETQPPSEKGKRDVRKIPSFSGPLMLPNRASANSLSAPIRSSGGFRDSLDEKTKANVVQIKGRFSVTSEKVDLVKEVPLCTVPCRSSQGSPLRKSASVGDWLLDCKPVDLIMSLLNCLQQAEEVDAVQSGKLPLAPRNVENDANAEAAASERERLLLLKIMELQSRMICLTDELTAEKLKHMQLRQHLSDAFGRKDDDDDDDDDDDGSRRGGSDARSAGQWRDSVRAVPPELLSDAGGDRRPGWLRLRGGGHGARARGHIGRPAMPPSAGRRLDRGSPSHPRVVPYVGKEGIGSGAPGDHVPHDRLSGRGEEGGVVLPIPTEWGGPGVGTPSGESVEVRAEGGGGEEELLIMCQIETEEGAKRAGEIAAVEGVHCVQMGPLDLSGSLGHLWDPGHPKVREVMGEVEKAVLLGGSAYLGGFAMPHDGPHHLRARGYHMVSGAVDVALFRTAAVEDRLADMELFYLVVFGGLSLVVAGVELSKNSKDRITTSAAFNAFKNNYVLVYSLMMGISSLPESRSISLIHCIRNFDQQWLSLTFSKAIFFGNGLVAILSGLLGNVLTDALGFGPVAPFDAAACFLAIGMAIILSSWTENYGDPSESKDLLTQFKGAAVAIASGEFLHYPTFGSDERIALLGAIQSLFEDTLYATWNFPIFPSLPVFSAFEFLHYPTFGSDERIALLGAKCLSSIAARLLARVSPKVESYMQIVFAVSAFSLFLPVITSFLIPPSNVKHGGISFAGCIHVLGFCAFEACVGIFWPSIMKMRSQYIPEESRSTIMNFFRIPLNIFVCVVLYNVNAFPITVMFGMCSIFLFMASILQRRLASVAETHRTKSQDWTSMKERDPESEPLTD